MSQRELARRIKVSYQQVQRYENGRNRIMIGRLSRIADVLGVSLNVLLYGVEAPKQIKIAGVRAKGALRLAAAVARIECPETREAFISFVERLARRPRN
jgi:transcriptional regulator with XRE-family HTH domain